MRPRSDRVRLTPLLRGLAPAAACLTVLALAGCEDESTPKRAGAGKKASAPAQPEFIVGKRTMEVKNAAEEEKKGATVITKPRITAKDPITLQGNAYVTAIGKLSIAQIQQAMELYKATNDRYPANYDEFLAEIIRANNIALPKLPYYQAYGYDEKEHRLVILEYPDKKNAPLPGMER